MTDLKFNYIIFQARVCLEETPFYYAPTSMCYNICPPYYYPNYTSSNYTCVSCSNSGYHPFLTCTPYCNDTMLNCAYSFNSSTCLSCLIGSSVIGGCTDVIGCTAVSQFNQYSDHHTAVCALCRTPEFRLYPANGVCKCTSGVLATYACTRVLGCITAQIIGSNLTSTCLGCNISLGFSLKDGICVCADGYYIFNSKCAQICGDGRLFALACDDGNNLNGDGCSSSCRVESDYECSGGD